ncbi:MAG TPA: response regulator transcription factor [Burkholderiaceae bacterium]
MADISDSKLILLVEDHPVVAQATSMLLMQIDDSLRITTCGSATAALTELGKTREWHRIFLDIDVPGAHGLSLARQFAKLGMANKCTIITGSNNPQWRAEAVAMGMLGYIVKAIRVEDFKKALQAVLKGDATFLETASPEKPQAIRLTRRQQDVLRLICRGLSTPEIATQLGLTSGTVDDHVKALLMALEVKNRAQAVAKAIELGQIDLHSISK